MFRDRIDHFLKGDKAPVFDKFQELRRKAHRDPGESKSLIGLVADLFTDRLRILYHAPGQDPVHGCHGIHDTEKVFIFRRIHSKCDADLQIPDPLKIPVFTVQMDRLARMFSLVIHTSLPRIYISLTV